VGELDVKQTDRRSDGQLRATIKQYRDMAAKAEKDAAICKDAATRRQFLDLSKSLKELADTLQGRPTQ
jgi:hypothetical protein